MIEKVTKKQEVYVPSRYKELIRGASKKRPIRTVNLATNEFPVYDLHVLAEETVINRNRYGVVGQDGKFKIEEASWMTAKRLSFTKDSRLIAFSTLPDCPDPLQDILVPSNHKVCTVDII